MLRTSVKRLERIQFENFDTYNRGQILSNMPRAVFVLLLQAIGEILESF